MSYDAAGIPSISGTALLDAQALSDRYSRYQLRKTSGKYYRDCLATGYIGGRDEETHQAANAALLEFLKRWL